MVLRGNTPPSTAPTMMDGHGGTVYLLSNQSLLLTSSLTKTGGRSSHCIVDESKTSQLVLYNHNDFYLNKVSFPPDNTTILLPTAYTSLSIPFHRTPALCNQPMSPGDVEA